MNNPHQAKLDPALKIGYTCFHMNISGIMELQDRLHYALAYTDLDFIYDFQHFFTYDNPKRPEEYISKDNELIIEGSIDLLFHRDYADYIDNNTKSFNLFDYTVHVNPKEKDLAFETLFIEQGIPLIFPCDHYYLFQEYREQFPAMYHFHTGGHSAVLVDVDFAHETCTILDKFYAALFTTSIEKYIQAKTSEHLRNSKFLTANIVPTGLQRSEEIRALLKKNIARTLPEEITINGNTYAKNIKGIQILINDLPTFLQEMSNLKGKYAPQFTTRVFRPIILQRIGFKNLIWNLSQEVEELQPILQPLEETMKKWLQVDMLCDKCFLKNDFLPDYTENYLHTFQSIYEAEAIILDTLSSIEKML